MTADKQLGAFAWTTLHEVRFIQTATQIDRHEKRRNRIERCDFLRGYIAGSLRRTAWGVINREAVMTVADALLKENS